MKLLVIGCGSIGQRHLGNLRVLGLRELAACDIDPVRLAQAAEHLGVAEGYTDYRQAAEAHPDLDAAVIATPSNLHLGLARR